MSYKMPPKRSFRTSHYINSRTIQYDKEKIQDTGDRTEDDIKRLLPYKDIYINNLDVSLDESYRRIVKKSLSDDIEVRKRLADTIAQYMNPDENVKSFTVGAYLMAAMRSPTLSPSCNPLTSNMIHQKCQNNIIWAKKTDRGTQLQTVTDNFDPNKKTYVFMQPGVTADIIDNQLADMGISTYSPIVASDDGRRILDTQAEVSVRRRPATTAAVAASPAALAPQTAPVVVAPVSRSGKSSSWIWIALLILVVILLLLYFFGAF